MLLYLSNLFVLHEITITYIFKPSLGKAANNYFAFY